MNISLAGCGFTIDQRICKDSETDKNDFNRQKKEEIVLIHNYLSDVFTVTMAETVMPRPPPCRDLNF